MIHLIIPHAKEISALDHQTRPTEAYSFPVLTECGGKFIIGVGFPHYEPLPKVVYVYLVEKVINYTNKVHVLGKLSILLVLWTEIMRSSSQTPVSRWN